MVEVDSSSGSCPAVMFGDAAQSPDCAFTNTLCALATLSVCICRLPLQLMGISTDVHGRQAGPVFVVCCSSRCCCQHHTCRAVLPCCLCTRCYIQPCFPSVQFCCMGWAPNMRQHSLLVSIHTMDALHASIVPVGCICMFVCVPASQLERGEWCVVYPSAFFTGVPAAASRWSCGSSGLYRTSQVFVDSCMVWVSAGLVCFLLVILCVCLLHCVGFD